MELADLLRAAAKLIGRDSPMMTAEAEVYEELLARAQQCDQLFAVHSVDDLRTLVWPLLR